MLQVFIFHGYDIDGQRACTKASAKVNRFLQEHQVTNPHIATNFATAYSADLGNCACECVVTVVGHVEKLIDFESVDFTDQEQPTFTEVIAQCLEATSADTDELLF